MMTDFELKTLITMLFTKKKDFKEYLKVYEGYIGQKFLESYGTQSVYTSVYWVHQVDGQIVETYLATSELASWECETLEPYYYTDADRQYIGYYQIPVGTDFGQHDMKITYKSPDTGNILSVEYPIYYLEEINLINNLTETFDWYPFRNPFAYSSIGSATLKYQCYDSKGDLVEYDYLVSMSITEFEFKFPTVENAQYRFGENQKVDTYYVSPNTLKEYYGSITINIRPYYDERNLDCNYVGTSSSVTKHYYKNIRPMSITFDTTPKTFYTANSLTIIKSSQGYFESADLYYDPNSATCGYILQDDTKFHYYNDIADIENIYKNKGYTTTSNNEISIPYLTSATTYLPNDSRKYNVDSSTVGYAYWGDGTFSRVILSRWFQGNSTSYINSTNKTSEFGSIRIRNGYKLNGTSRVYNYEDVAFFDNQHTYDENGIYNVELTNSFSFSSYSTKPVVKYNEYFLSANYTFPSYDACNLYINAKTTDDLQPSNKEMYWFKNIHLPTSNNGNYIKSFDFGETTMFGNAKSTTNVRLNSGYEDFYQFNLQPMLSRLCNLETIRIPKLSDINLTKSAFEGCQAVKNIIYDGLLSDLTALTNQEKKYFAIGLSYGQNAQTLEQGYNTITITCKDGSIQIQDLLSSE